VAVTLLDRGNEHFHDARSALASFCGEPSERFFVLVPLSSRIPVTSAGLLDAAAFGGMRPLTPLSQALLPLRAHVTFVRGLESTRAPLWFRTTLMGRKSEEPAETALATDP
jgi:tRNA U34 5-methylaminomethyl-2-thiouridine-forming methyltransferase MnmC